MNELVNYGVLGIVLVVFAIWYAKKDKQHGEERERIENLHRQEREDWNRINQRQLEETNRNIKDNTNILSALKTLLESRK
jgi:hypothetical protein